MTLLKHSVINSILHCSTEIYRLGLLYQHCVLLYTGSNICIRKVIAEMGTWVPVSISDGYPVFKYPNVRPLHITCPKYLFAPAIICQVYQLVDSQTFISLYSFKILMRSSFVYCKFYGALVNLYTPVMVNVYCANIFQVAHL